MAGETVADVIIYAEHEQGIPKRSSTELASKAVELAEAVGGSPIAVVLGLGATEAAQQLGRFGIKRAYVCDDDAFTQYLTEPHVDTLVQIISRRAGAIVLFPFTPDCKDIAGRLSMRVDAGLVANVVDLVAAGGGISARETVFGGTYTTTVEVAQGETAMYLVRPNAFAARECPSQISLETVQYVPSERAERARLGERVQEESAQQPLEEAGTIVAGGRGLGGPEPFDLLHDLADALDGSVAASRAAVDAGWISYEHQVGQTGRTVKPQLYIAVGISGAVQHRVGMQTADTIIAINKAEDVPIFQLADLAVVGDLFQIVPALTQAIRKRKGE